jgi:hypothetical protein
MEIKIVQYANKEIEKTINYLNSLKRMINNNYNTNYYFIADNDNSSPYPDKKINHIKKTYKHLKEENIIIVKEEIENWYLAGISKKACRKLNLSKIKDADKISKENFVQRLKNRTRFDAYSEILSDYLLVQAKEKSDSFKYFIDEIGKYL